MSTLNTLRNRASRSARRMSRSGRYGRRDTRHLARDARDWAIPRLEHTGELLRDDVLPRVRDGARQAMTASEPFRREAGLRSRGVFAALRGQLTAKDLRRARRRLTRGRRLGRAALVLGAFGTLVTVWSWYSRHADADWIRAQGEQESLPDAADQAGSSPDEALADFEDTQRRLAKTKVTTG